MGIDQPAILLIIKYQHCLLGSACWNTRILGSLGALELEKLRKKIGPQYPWDCSQHQALGTTNLEVRRTLRTLTMNDYDLFIHIHPHGCVRVRARVRLLQRCHRVHQHSAINECKSQNMPTHQKQKIISSLAMLK